MAGGAGSGGAAASGAGGGVGGASASSPAAAATTYSSQSGSWRALVAGCLALLSVAIYWNSLTGEFVFDDKPALVDNADVRGDTSIATLFSNNFWGQTMGDPNAQHYSYRPLTVLTSRWSAALHGLSPYGFHMANILLHAATTVLFFFTSLDLCHGHVPDTVSAVAGLLFALHPVHTEAVSNCVCRAEMLCAIFMLLSLRAYMQACDAHPSSNSGGGGGGQPAGRHWLLWTALSLLFNFAALLSKEPGITVGLVCIFYDIFFVAKFDLQSLITPSARRSPKDGGRVSEKKKAAMSAASGGSSKPWGAVGLRTAIVVLYLAVTYKWRVSLNNGQETLSDEKTNPSVYIKNYGHQLLTKHLYVSLHAWLLVWPVPLCCDWSSFGIANISSWLDPRVAGVAACYVTLFLLGLVGFAKSIAREVRALFLFGLAWTVVTFLPASGLLVEVGYAVAERLLYTPSMGFCLYAALGGWFLYSRGPAWLRSVLPALLVVVLCLYGVRIWTRNEDWASERSLYESGLKVLPDNAKLNFNYGWTRNDDPLLQERHYRKAIQMYPFYGAAYVNLGVNLINRGLRDEAVEIWKEGLERYRQRPIITSDPEVMTFNIALTYMQTDRCEEAIPYLEACKRYGRPRCTDDLVWCHNRLKEKKQQSKT
eukprot:m.59591 g.59591  ORF g.59591 m.59591 type:complete len:651 (+) comp13595_c0_seq2:136-2088(+)